MNTSYTYNNTSLILICSYIIFFVLTNDLYEDIYLYRSLGDLSLELFKMSFKSI